MKQLKQRATPGRPLPLGATVTPEGINFAVFSQHATRLYLELFRHPDEARPTATFALDPPHHRTGDVWHIFIQGPRHGQLYGLRADGPYRPEEGHRFNVNKLLSDPYARLLVGRYRSEEDAVYGFCRGSAGADLSFNTADSARYTVKSVAVAPSPFSSGGEPLPPRTPLDDSVIYEVHVKGLTRHPSSGFNWAGTYRGLLQKVPHLRDLGVTAVELLPIHHFNPLELDRTDPTSGAALSNYWGYSTLGFFSPEQTYAADRSLLGPLEEFRQMVCELHRAGIEVILDVVFNHTGEGGELGPTFSFRGLDNAIYYMLEGGRRYKNYSGCGNTLNCNHPVVKQFILDCLRYWATEMGVDGFRFDLATILGRNSRGEWIGDLSLLYDIGGDPVLRGCKLIAEAWDAEGMYKVGGFPGSWAEWNGRFRDDLRRYVRGDRGCVPELARRLGGSLDLFARKTSPAHSINFITAHDGFTLRDLVSYSRKHNERNAEENRDGMDENYSASWGVEGETDDPDVRKLRRCAAKNLLALLLLSRGTPMLLGGDELWRTQQGNNNTYCQDNELSWLNWIDGPEAAEMLRFVGLLIALRRSHPALRRPCFVDPFAVDGAGVFGPIGADITWHGVQLGAPDWRYCSHCIALHIHGLPPQNAPHTADRDLYLMANMWEQPLTFELPALPAPQRWWRLLDTARPSPEDLLPEEEAKPCGGDRYRVTERSVVLLLAG